MELTDARLAEHLGTRPFRFFRSLPSTQDEALTWLRLGGMSGAVVIADEQTAGRGRQGRTWHTPPGVALALSVLLRPSMQALPQVTMLGALAVVRLLDALGAPDVQIKWPNDILLSSRKVSGILPEALWEGETLHGVALGMGMNVRVDFHGTDLDATAISLETALQRPLDRGILIKDLLGHVDELAQELGSAALFAEWKRHMNMLGQPVQIRVEGNLLSGAAEDVEPDGTLLLREPSGNLMRVIAGDVSFA